VQSMDHPGGAVEDSPAPVLLRYPGPSPRSGAGRIRKRPPIADPGRRPAPFCKEPDPQRAEEAKRTPYAALPHAIASDTRLSSTERLIVAALLYWALDDDRCTMADWRVADYVGVTRETVQRAYKRLQKFGHVRVEKLRSSARNRTGRQVILCFREDPSYLPAPPDRRGPNGRTRAVAAPAEGVMPTSHPAPGRRDSPCGAGVTPGVAPAPHKEKSLVVGEGREKSGEATAPAPQVTLTPAARPIGTERRDGSLISNENENAQAGPLDPGLRETAERMLRDPRVPETVKQQARGHLARDDAARAKSAAGGGTMMTSPKPADRMGPGELKARIATLMPNSKASSDTIALLEGLGPGCDPRQVDLCVRRLCRELDGDGHSQGYFVETLNSVRRGQIPAEAVVHAYVRACGPNVRRPGAAFVRALQTT
jgi:hypothetical protein